MAEWKPFDLKWGRSIWYCSACEESTEVPTYLGTPMYNFCPMCGANMNMKKADHKTENSSEKPNNCEHITEDGVTCAKYPACDDCLDNPLNKVKGSERLVKGSEQTEPNLILPERMERGERFEVGETIVVMNRDDYYDLLCKSWKDESHTGTHDEAIKAMATLIKAKTEPQIDDFFREPTAEERKAVAEYIESISVPTGVNVFDLMDEQTEREGE